MAAFMVVSLAPSPTLDAAIANIYRGAYLALSPSAWLVSDIGATTQSVCSKVNIKEGGISDAVVIKVESYFGFASPAIWEWLKTRVAEP